MNKNAFKHAAMNMGRMVGDDGIHGDVRALRAAKKKAPGNEAKPEHPGPPEDLTHDDLAHAGRPHDESSGAQLGMGDDTTEQYEDTEKFDGTTKKPKSSRDELSGKSGSGKDAPTDRKPGHEDGAAIPHSKPMESEDQGEKPVGAVGRMEGAFKGKPKRTVHVGGAASFGNRRK